MSGGATLRRQCGVARSGETRRRARHATTFRLGRNPTRSWLGLLYLSIGSLSDIDDYGGRKPGVSRAFISDTNKTSGLTWNQEDQAIFSVVCPTVAMASSFVPPASQTSQTLVRVNAWYVSPDLGFKATQQSGQTPAEAVPGPR